MWVSKYKKFLRESGDLVPAISYAAGYALWNALFKLVTLTFVTYFLMSPSFKLQDISEAFSSNEVVITGFSAGFFLLFLNLLYPLAGPIGVQLWNGSTIRETFLPNLFKGLFLAVILASVLLLSGYYHYVGYLIHSDETFLVMVSVFLRITALFLLVYCEEFIFRRKILATLREKMPGYSAVIVTNFLYCGIKFFQFDLDAMQLATLFLISTAMGLKYLETGHFTAGAGLFAGFLLMLHSLLGLPIFQNEFPGIFLIKYQENQLHVTGMAKFLTGGEVGPLSGLLLQILVLLEFTRQFVKRRLTYARK